MSPIIIATLSVTVIGLLIGLMLVNVGKKFAVDVDERAAAVRDCLPGNNCGGCGYAGCDALAAAISKKEARVDACPVGGGPVAEKIGHIMGVEAEEMDRMVAFVKCSGDCEHTFNRANYIGIEDCQSAVSNGLDAKSCAFGCLGFGSCVKACQFDAIHIIGGIAVVDREACKACGQCVIACPKHLIELLPDKSQYAVACVNTEKGPVVKKACTVGCIGCGICVRQCENDAVHVENFISRIDYEKCVSCGKCAEKCPSKVIQQRFA